MSLIKSYYRPFFKVISLIWLQKQVVGHIMVGGRWLLVMDVYPLSQKLVSLVTITMF